VSEPTDDQLIVPEIAMVSKKELLDLLAAALTKATVPYRLATDEEVEAARHDPRFV
jgi:hypothetical protein